MNATIPEDPRTPLHVPDSTLELFFGIAGDGMYEHDDPALEDLRTLAAPIVAAELRRVADQLIDTYSPDTPQIHSAMELVRFRANELDGTS